ncbi:hypothetical protein C362_04002 [Cryptococcus neoformans Bt1]|nr:hypothetical protein C362_04002 [Cryptococcus neoformans var. grubii Bt1]OXG20265.1 hypothetical protein C367_04414 [Cryptococcus neoformans var. grubii Ze90-1]
MLAVAHCLAVLSSSVRDDAKAACSRWRRQTRQSISECGTPFGQYVTSQLLNLLIPYFITYLQRCQTDCAEEDSFDEEDDINESNEQELLTTLIIVLVLYTFYDSKSSATTRRECPPDRSNSDLSNSPRCRSTDSAGIDQWCDIISRSA